MPEFVQNIDWTLINLVHEKMSCGFLDAVMPAASMLCSGGGIWIAAGIVLLFFKKYRGYGVVLLAAVAADFLLGEVLIKHLAARPRPFRQEEIELIVRAPSGFSFPSSHTSVSAAAAFVLAAAKRKLGLVAIPLAAVIAFSRVYLYVHFPSDVLAGAVLGTAVGFAAVMVYRKVILKKESV